MKSYGKIFVLIEFIVRNIDKVITDITIESNAAF